MREFHVQVSKHRPDGCITLWISATRNFSMREMNAKLNRVRNLVTASMREMNAKLNRVRNLVTASIFPLRRFVYCFQSGQTIFESNDFEVIFEKERFIEFVVDTVSDVVVLLSFLGRLWGGRWHIEPCEWSDPFAYAT